MAGRCLIVANQTLGAEVLSRSIKDCLSRGITLFYVVVPMTPLEHESSAWAGGFSLTTALGTPNWSSPAPDQKMRAVLEDSARLHEAKLDEARGRAEHRLALMIDKIRSMGGDAAGEVGREDPLEASKAALKHPPFDEIIVSTLPSGLSRWLKRDLPNRIARITDIPVTTIEAEED